MIVAASGSVPWRTTIIVGVIAATGGPLAVYFQNRHQEVATKSDLKHAAYERLIAASEIVAYRSTVLGGQRSARSAFAHTIWDMRKALLVLIIGSLPVRQRSKSAKLLPRFFEAIPTPEPFKDSMNTDSLQATYEDLVRAYIGVSLYGSAASVLAAEKLLDDAKRFFDLMEKKGSWTKTGLPPMAEFSQVRGAMVDSTAKFVTLARAELKP